MINARAKATQTNIKADNLNNDNIRQFQQAQGELSSALSRLMVVIEKYPELKADQNFRDLQAQLEGTENRITVARNRYIESIKGFNNLVSVPPSSWTNSLFYHHEKMPQWTLADQELKVIQDAPKVEF